MCKLLAERVQTLERELVDTRCGLEEVTAYAGVLHEQLNENRGNRADIEDPSSGPRVR